MNTDTEYISLGKDILDPTKFHNIKNQDVYNKPLGGLWISKFNSDDRHPSNWSEFAEGIGSNFSRSFNVDKGIVVKLKAEANIYVIDTINSFKNLYDKYINMNNPLNDLDAIFKMTCIDFEKMSEDYDGIMVTDEMINVIRMSNLFIDKPILDMHYYAELGCWDVESICLFNLECVSEWKPWYKK